MDANSHPGCLTGAVLVKALTDMVSTKSRRMAHVRAAEGVEEATKKDQSTGLGPVLSPAVS
jgi:hypothetical protein